MARPQTLAAVLAFVVLASGCLGGTTAPKDVSDGTIRDDAELVAARTGIDAVVSFIDTGINVYHESFRDDSPEAFLHPSLYIEGYPADAAALNVTLNATTYWAAVKKDCESVWSKIEAGKLYWVPGTKIIGAISFGTRTANCSPARPTPAGILDTGSHGTMVSSRGASTQYGGCHECKIVFIQGFTPMSVKWAGDQANWIDSQSNSWGPFLPLIAPDAAGGGVFVNSPSLVRTIEAAAKRHLAFWASGNGALTRLGVLGHPTIIDPRMAPSIVMVGGHDSGYMNTWPDFPPHVVSDSCDSWAAYQDNLTRSGDRVGGGTSGATPFAAGVATDLLLQARILLNDTLTGVRDGVVAKGTKPASIASGPLSDGQLTLAEWKTLVFKTATARPKRQYEDGAVCSATEGNPLGALYASTPVQWKDVPAEYPEFFQLGYGAVDNESRVLAYAVLGGTKPLPDRMRTDAYFAADAAVRGTLHTVYST